MHAYSPTCLARPPVRRQITDCGPNDNWTCITFFPDFARFNMEGLEEDTVELMRKRVFDMAGMLGKTVKVRARAMPAREGRSLVSRASPHPPLPPPSPAPHAQVYLNGERLKTKTFQEYVDLYLGPKDSGPARVYERFNDRWEVCISITDGQFNQARAPACLLQLLPMRWVEHEAERLRGGPLGQRR